MPSYLVLLRTWYHWRILESWVQRQTGKNNGPLPCKSVSDWWYWRVFKKGTQPWSFSTLHWCLNSRASLIIWHCKDYPLLFIFPSISGVIIHNLSHFLYPADTVGCYDPSQRNFQKFPAPNVEKCCTLFVLISISTSCTVFL